VFDPGARHGGIWRALPHRPDGIQQPALSGRMLALERELGVTLLSRRPFARTAAGMALSLEKVEGGERAAERWPRRGASGAKIGGGFCRRGHGGLTQRTEGDGRRRTDGGSAWWAVRSARGLLCETRFGSR
jgi:hypothetical protein